MQRTERESYVLSLKGLSIAIKARLNDSLSKEYVATLIKKNENVFTEIEKAQLTRIVITEQEEAVKTLQAIRERVYNKLKRMYEPPKKGEHITEHLKHGILKYVDMHFPDCKDKEAIVESFAKFHKSTNEDIYAFASNRFNQFTKHVKYERSKQRG